MNKFDQIINEFTQQLTLNKDNMEKKLAPLLKGADTQTKGVLNTIGDIFSDTTEIDPKDVETKNLFDKLIDDNTPDEEKIKIKLDLISRGILPPDQKEEDTTTAQSSTPNIKQSTSSTSPKSSTSISNSISYKV
jgi:hypothetical protein